MLARHRAGSGLYIVRDLPEDPQEQVGQCILQTAKACVYRSLTKKALRLSNIGGLPYFCHALAPLRPQSGVKVPGTA